MTLTRLELRWARAALEAVFPGSHGIAPLDVEGYLGEMLRAIPFEPALGLRAAIWLVAHAPLFVIGRSATIHGIAPADRERVIVRLASSASYPVRQLVLLLKTMGALLYAGDDEVRARIYAPARPETGPLRLRKKANADARETPERTPEKKTHAVRLA
jgi:hypothetical protein